MLSFRFLFCRPWLRLAWHCAAKYCVLGVKQSSMLQVRFQVTPEGVQQIFAEKPHVHRAFLANVPASMDENAFWTRFFKNELNRQVSCSYPCMPSAQRIASA